MSIVATEVESIHGDPDKQRLVFYRCQDHLGVWHSFGPLVTTDPQFDVDAFKVSVAESVSRSLAESEFEDLIDG